MSLAAAKASSAGVPGLTTGYIPSPGASAGASPAATPRKSKRAQRPPIDVFTAADRADVDVVRTWIVDFKVDPDVRDDLSQTLLMRACLARAPAVVSFLLSRGAFADTKAGFFGETPLLSAVSVGSPECVRLLCENGHVNVNVKTGSGQTPLICAARKGSLDIVKTLIEFGAKVDARDQWGRTALIHAAQVGAADIVKTLLGLNVKGDAPAPATASPSKRDNEGRTALHEAALSGSVASIAHLLRAGAKLHRRDMAGMTPLDLAESAGKNEAAEALARAWQAEVEKGRRASSSADSDVPQLVVQGVAGQNGVGLVPLRDRSGSTAFLTPASIAAAQSDSDIGHPIQQPLYHPAAGAGAADAPAQQVNYGHIDAAEMQSPLVQGLGRLAQGVGEGDRQVQKAVDDFVRVRSEVGGLVSIKKRKDDVKSRLAQVLSRLSLLEADLAGAVAPGASSSDSLAPPPSAEAPTGRRGSLLLTGDLRDRARRLVAEARQGLRVADEGDVLCREWSEKVAAGKMLVGEAEGATGEEVEAVVEGFEEFAKLVEANAELEKRFQSTQGRLSGMLPNLPQLVAAHLTTSHSLLHNQAQLARLVPLAARYVEELGKEAVRQDEEYFSQVRDRCMAKLREYEGRRGSRANLV